MEIQMYGGGVAVIDAADAPLAAGLSWHSSKGRHTTYAKAWLPGTGGKVYLHRLILGVTCRIDHRDGNGLNNTRDNLRAATNRQNQQNQKAKGGRSIFKGVTFEVGRPKTPWAARIRDANGVRKHIGRFATEEQAAQAYDENALIYHGEFANLNFQAVT